MPKNQKPHTRDQIWIDKEVYKGPAWRDLNGTAKTILADFWCMRQWAKNGKKGAWYISNNDELEYHYSTAEKKGIPRPRFTRAIDDLIEHGFLDISRQGQGQYRISTLYSLSSRYLKWGTPEYKIVTRKKGRKLKDGFGFKRQGDMVTYRMDTKSYLGELENGVKQDTISYLGR